MNAQTKIEAPNIAQRLNAAMAEVDYVQKEKKSGMNYSIVSHDAVTAKVRPILQKHGVVYYPHSLEVRQDGNRTAAIFIVRFENIDDRADYIDVATFGYGVDPQDKGPGKAISYGVKYALLKVLGLETGDDPDVVQDNRTDYQPNPQTGERDDDPREKVEGITKIKATLRLMQAAGDAMDDLDMFNELISANAEQLTKIRNANHEWWTGDGADFEGYRAWIKRRREELAEPEDGQFKMLMDSLKTCDTLKALTNWRATNEALIEALDGAESRTFQTAFDLQESIILEMGKASA